MPVKLQKERFIEKYDGVTSPILLPPGAISGGLNMRKISAIGGWKVRKGCTTHNTTAIGAAAVLSLHNYVHPRLGDYHFLAQCNEKLVEAGSNPPSSGATFGTDITNGQTISASQPGFSDVVGDQFVYADGGKPLTWGGDSPYCTGFLAWDNSEGALNDFTVLVSDGRTDTQGLILGAASDVYYVHSNEIASSIILNLGTGVNSSSATATVSSWQSGAWSDRSATDGTKDGDVTHAVDGSLTWTPSSDDTMRVLGGIMGYWYRVSFSGALSGSIDVISCKVEYDLSEVSNKWDGVYRSPLSAVFFDQSTGEYLDLTGDLTVESTSLYFNISEATTSDFLYIKSEVPLTGVGLGVAPGYENTADAQFDNIDDWDGDSWNTISSGITDETLDVAGDSSLASSGVVWWNAAGRTIRKRAMPFDSLPGYWYRLSWDAAFSNTDTDVRLYFVGVAAFPDSLPTYDGVIEFKGRAMYWGDPGEPNRLRYSEKDRPDQVLEPSRSYTDSFGDKTVLVCCTRFYNELVIFKRGAIWLLEGFSKETFGNLEITNTVGCCAPKTVKTIETGYPSMHADEPLSIIIWMDTDGIYVMDGRKPKKISAPINHYFDTEYSTAISAANRLTAQAFVDRLKNEYHLLIADGTELVYNYVTDEWYPPWSRSVGGSSTYLRTGLNLKDTNSQDQVYAGNSAGKVFRLENDTSDKNDSNVDVVIDHYIISRAICYEGKDSITFDFILRGIIAEAKARTSGEIVTTILKNLETSGTVVATPANISLVNTGYGVSVDGLDISIQGCKCFQAKFRVNTLDVELEIYTFLYLLDIEGESVI